MSKVRFITTVVIVSLVLGFTYLNISKTPSISKEGEEFMVICVTHPESPDDVTQIEIYVEGKKRVIPLPNQDGLTTECSDVITDVIPTSDHLVGEGTSIWIDTSPFNPEYGEVVSVQFGKRVDPKSEYKFLFFENIQIIPSKPPEITMERHEGKIEIFY